MSDKEIVTHVSAIHELDAIADALNGALQFERVVDKNLLGGLSKKVEAMWFDISQIRGERMESLVNLINEQTKS